ncbi:MAG: cytochrome c biogenesis protein CcsA [Phycisphaeraceae bacterium]
MNGLKKALPFLVIALTVGYLLSKLISASLPGPMDLTAFSRIPVSADGRIQPLDSLARNTLLTISKKTTFKNVWLRPQQVKNYQGLAKALLEGKSSTALPVAQHLWSVMSEEQRATVTTAAMATDVTPQMKYDLVETMNELIDNDLRWLHAVRDSLRPDGDRKVHFTPFYDEASFKSIELSTEDRAQLKVFDDYRKSVENKSKEKPFYSRPDELELNRQLLSRAFPDFVSAMSAANEPAIIWLADAIVDQGKGESHRVFRIEHDRVLELMGLPSRPGNLRYAIDEFRGNFDKLEQEVKALQGKPSKEMDAYQKAVTDLRNDLIQYMIFAQGHKPYWIPPAKKGDGWRTFPDAAAQADGKGFYSEEFTMLKETLMAYAKGNVAEFNAGVTAYQTRFERTFPGDFNRTQFELKFNQVDVFGSVGIFFVFAFLFVAFSWLMGHDPDWARSLRNSATGMLAVVSIAYTFGLLGRMYLMDRPFVFVTNLYGSALFIGWVVMLGVFVLEWFTRLGIGSAVACLIGGCTSIVAVNLREIEGDTLAQMQAVLDTNFWLATHVTTVTIGYAATFLAGALGIAYIFAGLCTKTLSKDDPGLAIGLAGGVAAAMGSVGGVIAARAMAGAAGHKAGTPRKPQTIGKVLTGMIYGVICFAMLFSFVGTVLGGIWADQSWGRFWGWDPKENGALMIVIWNALILHARWGGLIKARGLATLAVFGNIVTTWSWFGTNQLGAGLHSYGFMDSAVFWIYVFVVSQLAIMAISLVPLKYWRSFAETDGKAAGKTSA